MSERSFTRRFTHRLTGRWFVRSVLAASVIGPASPLLRSAFLSPAMAQVAPAPGAQQPSAPQTFTQEQLDQMLAPIALYPDSLLSQVFMAATYPIEVVDADRWVKANPSVQGDQLAADLDQQTWDPSVKSLVNVPQVLDMMSTQLDWTTRLGDAFIGQQPDVMARVQALRAQAQQAGQLVATPQQQVTADQGAIVIADTDPNVVYVPVYDPNTVYGSWAYADYPPFYYYPPVTFAARGFSSARAFTSARRGAGRGAIGIGTAMIWWSMSAAMRTSTDRSIAPAMSRRSPGTMRNSTGTAGCGSMIRITVAACGIAIRTSPSATAAPALPMPRAAATNTAADTARPPPARSSRRSSLKMIRSS